MAGVGKGDTIPPSVIERPRIIKNDTNRSVRFEVKLRAKPEPQISWFKEKSALVNGNKFKIDVKKEADNVFIMTLEIKVILEHYSYNNKFFFQH